MIDTPGMTAEQYDATMAELGEGLPEGCSAHISGPSPDGSGWRVISVWDDIDTARQFMITRMGPAREAAGVQPATATPVSWPLHNMIGSTNRATG
jgi:hypothetical protein